jgi:hypothetical protein
LRAIARVRDDDDRDPRNDRLDGFERRERFAARYAEDHAVDRVLAERATSARNRVSGEHVGLSSDARAQPPG